MDIENIALYDMDGTLCDYDLALRNSMEKLRSLNEPPYSGKPEDDAPAYLKARADLIMSRSSWWAEMPKFQLGFDIWELTKSLGFRHMILTQGPRKRPKAWMGKKMWIDKNIGKDVDITITRDKGLVYGKILVDDWPEYVTRWLEWRPRGLVIMPLQPHNKSFKHPQVVHYDGKNIKTIEHVIRKTSRIGQIIKDLKKWI